MRSTLAFCAVLVHAHAFRHYPHYLQCDPLWGNDTMGTPGPGEQSTICGEGCAMSCVAMGLAGLDFRINNQPSTPATLNTWLQSNKGYECLDGDCNNLVLAAPTWLDSGLALVGEIPPPPVQAIQAGLQSGEYIYAAHVRNRTHFVLLTGFDPTSDGDFFVNDPNNHSNIYPYGNISDIIVYRVLPPGGDGVRITSDSHDVILVSNRYRTTSHYLMLEDPSRLRQADIDFPPHVAPRAPEARPIIPFKYPFFRQCDPRWGNDMMDNLTLCDVGCLETSTSMALAFNNISIGGDPADPATFNAWLRSNGGYDGANGLNEDAVPALNPAHIQWNDASDMHTTNDIPLDKITGLVASGQPVIAWVLNRTHFVLVTGWDGADKDTLYVHDPYFDRGSYSYANDVVGWRLFQMEACSSSC